MMRLTSIRLLAVALCALSVCAAHAQETAVAPTGAMAKPEVVHGQATFVQKCAACHGTAATGGMGPNLITSGVVRHDVGGNEIGTVIHEGRMDKGMPAFPEVTAAQAAEIAAFLHARVASTSRASALSGSTADAGHLLSGNVDAGHAFFTAKCAGCHSANSPTGDLKGVATKHQGYELMTTMLYPKGVADTGTVTPKTHPDKTLKGTFVHRDEFTVTLRTADGVTHTWQTPEVTLHVDDALRGHRELLHTYTNKDMHDVFAYLETLR